MTKPLLIISTGHAPDAIRGRLGDFDHWFRIAMHVRPGTVKVVDAVAGAGLPAPASVGGAVITGSMAMVTDRLDWSEHLAGWIRSAMDAELPLFGVCYGHQLMAQALGGKVDDLPGGREIGTRRITVSPEAANDPLLAGLPNTFLAHTTHVQSVLEIPSGAVTLASSERDANQIVRYGPHAVSSQLHPEFSVSTMRAYLRLRSRQLRGEGLDVPGLLKATAATPYARRMVRRFAHRALETAQDEPERAVA